MKKPDHESFAERWKHLHSQDWLFPDNGELMTSQDYLEYFHHRYGQMMLCRCPTTYKFSLLESHKEKIVFGSHMLDGPQIIPFTMMQFAPSLHVAADWIWNIKSTNFVLALSIFYGKNKEYSDCLNNFKEHEFYEEEDALGFNTHKGFGFSHNVEKESV